MGLVALNISAAFLPFFKVFNHTRFYSVIALQRINIELRREASIATHKNDPISCVSGPICLNFVGIKTVVEMQTTTGWKNCVVLWNVVPGTQSSRRFGVKTWLWSGKTDIFWFSSVHKYTTELLLFQQFIWVFFSTFSIRQNIIPPDICLNGLMMCKAFFFYREPYLRGSLPGTFGLTVLNCTRLYRQYRLKSICPCLPGTYKMSCR